MPFSLIVGHRVKGHGRGHVVDQYRLGVAAALGVVVGDRDADGAGVAGRVVARCQAVVEVLVLDAESRPGRSGR